MAPPRLHLGCISANLGESRAASRWGPNETRENRFVFIGKDLDKEGLLKGVKEKRCLHRTKTSDEAACFSFLGFQECQCSEQLRFKIGDKVRARVGKDMAEARSS